jgi:signal transduction histidine kinase
MQNLIAPGGRFWTSAALSDGYGPDGRLVPTREWLSQLNERLRIETRIHELQQEGTRVIAGWRRTGLTIFALLGLAGAFVIIALPIRYRIRANRELLKIRERIAGDLHDEVGSNLGSIQMFADLAESRSGPSQELKRIQRIAAETVSAVRDIVWLLRPGGDHRIATVEHLRETSSIMLESLEWKFTANPEAWHTELREESNRDLFLFFREALHNILRHANARHVHIHAEAADACFKLIIEDDGCGIPPEKLERPATLRALRQRTEALGGELGIDSRQNEGTSLKLRVPLGRLHRSGKSTTPRDTH